MRLRMMTNVENVLMTNTDTKNKFISFNRQSLIQLIYYLHVEKSNRSFDNTWLIPFSIFSTTASAVAEISLFCSMLMVLIAVMCVY